MSNVLGQVLTTFAEDEGRDAASTAPDAIIKVRHLQRLIARRRAMRVGAISFASVAVLVGTVAGSTALIRLNDTPATDIAPFPVGVSASTATPSPTPTAGSATPTPTAGSVTDEVTCTAFGDVLTIVTNADVALREGRMQEQEQQGWDRLATRVLDRIPTSGDGAVSNAVAALKEVVPAIPLGVIQTTAVGSSEWASGSREVVDACADAGADVIGEGFTGG
jgi:hypothetical protein